MGNQITKGKEVKWIAVQVDPEYLSKGEESRWVLRKAIDGFLPLKEEEDGDVVPHYMLLNKNMNNVGFFQTVKKEICREIDVPVFWKLMFWFGMEINVSEIIKKEEE